MKIFVSQPMRGKSQDEILAVRRRAVERVNAEYGDEYTSYELIDSYFPDFDGNRIAFLGKSIMSALSQADVAVFVGNWYEYDGCMIEFLTAVRYELQCLFVD